MDCLRAWPSSLASSRRSPTAAEVRAMSAKWAKPISPSAIAFELWPRCSTCWPAQMRALPAPPLIWQLALSQPIGLSKPCQSFSYLAASFAATDEYDWQGFDSLIGWLKANCHMSGGAGSARICAGQQVEHLGQSSKAMGDGEIGFAHFALIARTSAAVGERLDEA